jgi:hypothetical protein
LILKESNVRSLLSSPETSGQIPELHDLVTAYRERARVHMQSPGCKGCKGALYVDDLIYKAFSVLKSLAPTKKQRLKKIFGGQDVFLVENKAGKIIHIQLT